VFCNYPIKLGTWTKQVYSKICDLLLISNLSQLDRVQTAGRILRVTRRMSVKAVMLSTVSLVAIVLDSTPVSATSSCEGLVNLSLPGAVVTAAQSVAGGTFNTPPGCTTGSLGCTTDTGLPAFCRVGTATPRSDSVINFEVWIPTDASFNEKYEQVGCGGFCGSITYSGPSFSGPNSSASLVSAIKRGYAGAATDDGSLRPQGNRPLL
jgi:hypothetical protein